MQTPIIRKLLGPTAVLLALAIPPLLRGDITLTQHGSPLFEPVGFVQTSIPWGHGVDWGEYNHFLDDLHEPFHEHYGESAGRNRGRVTSLPIGAHDGPYEDELRHALAKSGFVNSDVFSAEDVHEPKAILRQFNLVPFSDAPERASPDSKLDFVIPNEVFPLTINWEIHHDGRREFAFDWTILGLDDLPEFSGLSPSHVPHADLSYGFGGLSQMVGDYEDRWRISDKNGNGWTLVSEWETVRTPSAIVGDFNYNGELDSHDLNILTQNVAVAPTDGRTLSDDFLRLDMDGDETVDVNDVDHWVTDLKSTFIGDTNLDGEVEFDDFLAVSANFGQAGGWAEGDFNVDEQVNFADFLALSANFGAAANASASSVPEPTAASIALWGLLGLIGFRMRR
jgi:hypothetical protein